MPVCDEVGTSIELDTPPPLWYDGSNEGGTMTVEPSWRIACGGKTWGCRESAHLEMCYLRDTRLQYIADTWNARNEYQREDIYGYWPEFSDLLDALTEETTDD